MPRCITVLIALGTVGVVLDIVACILTPDALYGPKALLVLGRIVFDIGLAAAPLVQREIVRRAMIGIYGFGALLRGAVATGILVFGHRWQQPIWAGWVMAAVLCICVVSLGILFSPSARQHFKRHDETQKA
jgi:hypothetical protein